MLRFGQELVGLVLPEASLLFSEEPVPANQPCGPCGVDAALTGLGTP